MLGDSPADPFDPARLRLAGDLRRRGLEPSRRDATGQHQFHSVRHGVYLAAAEWDELVPVTRHAAFVHATALSCRPDSEAIYSHTSAAALWGMPRIEAWPSVAHVITLRPVRSSSLVRRHECEVDAYVLRSGLRVTLPARTVADLARTGSFVTALAAADFSLRHGLATRDELLDEADHIPRRARGRVRASLVAELADGRSMSAGESLSRAQMFVLNLPRPQLQVRCDDEAGLVGYTDFGWDGVVGEFDGQVKYRVPVGASAEDAARILWSEKRREDRLRGTGVRVARWVYAEALHPQQLARRLAAQGIRPTARNTWFDLAPGSA